MLIHFHAVQSRGLLPPKVRSRSSASVLRGSYLTYRRCGYTATEARRLVISIYCVEHVYPATIRRELVKS